MYRYSCHVCGGMCDVGELIGGVCPDCLEAAVQEEKRQEQRRKMVARHMVEQPDGQLSMIFN